MTRNKINLSTLELGYVERTSNFTTTNTTAVGQDIPSLSVTFTVPTSGNVYVDLGVGTIVPSVSYAAVSVQSGTDTIARLSNGSVVAETPTLFTRKKVSGLTPGASLTYRVTARTPSGSMTAGGSASVPIYMRVSVI